MDDVFVGALNPRQGDFPVNCGVRQLLPICWVGGVRGDFLLWIVALRAAAQLSACRRICSSVNVAVHFCSPSPARSKSPRHNKGSSCTRMPYFRIRSRSALTVYSVRIRPAAAPSNANTRNPVVLTESYEIELHFNAPTEIFLPASGGLSRYPRERDPLCRLSGRPTISSGPLMPFLASSPRS